MSSLPAPHAPPHLSLPVTDLPRCQPALLSGVTGGWLQWSAVALAARFGETRTFDLGLASGARASIGDVLLAAASGRSEPYIFDEDALAELDAEYSTDAAALPFPRADGLLEYLSSSHALRPAWRWLLIGPPGAGISVHQDPHATAAWNALLSGRKRWVMLPPATPIGVVLPSQAGAAPGAAGAALPASEATAAAWMANVLPGLRSRAHALGLLEFDQVPGEVLYVPPGWWHAALTTETSVAVTHNFLDTAGFAEALQRLEGAGDVERALAAAWRARAGAAVGGGLSTVATTALTADCG